MTNNIICLKYGTKYGPEYVNVLRRMVKRFCTVPYRFVCFTDNKYGIDEEIETRPLLCQQPNVTGWWHKLSFFQSQIYDLEGTALFLDLDIVVVNNLNRFFEFDGNFVAIWDWLHGPTKNVFNSSVMRWNIGEHTNIWQEFQKNPEQIISKYPTDQEFISAQSTLTAWPTHWCASYKWQRCWEAIDPETAVVVFHGRPNPPEAIRGFGSFPAAPWIRNFWR
jgi:hypothetical protein